VMSLIGFAIGLMTQFLANNAAERHSQNDPRPGVPDLPATRSGAKIILYTLPGEERAVFRAGRKHKKI
jgi:hypothetical protein